MSATQGRLILAIVDTGLRSILAAQLGMAGHMPISTVDHLDPTLSEHIRATALLIIEEALIAPPVVDWAETLRNQCWMGQIIVIVNAKDDQIQQDDKVMLVDRRDAGAAVLTLVHAWQSQATVAISRLE
ncbi:hypothetical protein [Sphingomonas sp. PAMC 26621]|uniref:hypothetical protein n=1 Tax=Sphingomonas sp. PAMC 26621 TaxID=1112213 RepID=UPI0005656F14|nr:hypothetical protein [Sphingomonas sp. PAMC 26621]